MYAAKCTDTFVYLGKDVSQNFIDQFAAPGIVRFCNFELGFNDFVIEEDFGYELSFSFDDEGLKNKIEFVELGLNFFRVNVFTVLADDNVLGASLDKEISVLVNYTKVA